ncbi:unnamed protein product [Eruca vesicaria subsp. sativa]|uniref:RNase H type-1 domain-containing protein n=1 Tax=Eruca vesicaria subsp. sativa TaxID=29727 RepID=A0ABC8JGG9_ERUVS|nr:unnamed protein product [Eruca vesicaria subsp. sativa]
MLRAGLTRILCKSDSAVLVKMLNEDTSLAGLYGILADISFNWISRMKNVETDKLIKQILSVELILEQDYWSDLERGA